MEGTGNERRMMDNAGRRRARSAALQNHDGEEGPVLEALVEKLQRCTAQTSQNHDRSRTIAPQSRIQSSPHRS